MKGYRAASRIHCSAAVYSVSSPPEPQGADVIRPYGNDMSGVANLARTVQPLDILQAFADYARGDARARSSPLSGTIRTS